MSNPDWTDPEDWEDRVECPECAGHGYSYGTGPSGAKEDCPECGGEGGWPASTLDMIDDLGERYGLDPIERPTQIDTFVRLPNLDLPQWQTDEPNDAEKRIARHIASGRAAGRKAA